MLRRRRTLGNSMGGISFCMGDRRRDPWFSFLEHVLWFAALRLRRWKMRYRALYHHLYLNPELLRYQGWHQFHPTMFCPSASFYADESPAPTRSSNCQTNHRHRACAGLQSGSAASSPEGDSSNCGNPWGCNVIWNWRTRRGGRRHHPQQPASDTNYSCHLPATLLLSLPAPYYYNQQTKR